MQSSNRPTISVIVPVYNAESTLNRCVDSILLQDFMNFELILVNDGSKDQSGEICDNYLSQDTRVKVIHKQNGGVSSARNMGLRCSEGEWIAFVDSDDWVSNTYLRNLLSDAQASGTSLVITYPIFHYSDGRVEKKSYPSLLATDDSINQVLKENYIHGTTAPWGKLFKSSIIHNNDLTFCEDMHIGEDALFFFMYLLHITKFYISENSDYNYMFETTGSLTKRVYDYTSEYIGYCNIINVLNQFVIQKKVYENEAISQIDWVKGYYERRLLNAQYYNKLSRSIRLRNLKGLDYSHYLNSVRINSIKEKLLAYLLRKRLYTIYDIIRVIIHSLKRYDSN